MSVVTPVTSRRSFIAVATAAAIMPAAVLAQQTDPILAVIDRHRAAFAEFGRASIANDTVAARQDGRIITQAVQDQYETAAEALDEASDLLASTAPTTMAGLAAAVSWLLEYAEGCIPDTSGRFLRTLATSPLMAGG